MVSNKCLGVIKGNNKAFKYTKEKRHLVVSCYVELENSDSRHRTI